MTFRIKDNAWVKQSFLLAAAASDDIDLLARTRTTASTKFVDTSLGGNYVINPLPQYTKYADIKRGGYNPAKPKEEMMSASNGMGRYYSEAIDDHNQVITMRFGLPQFNSMSSFLSGAVNAEAAYLARTGRAEGSFFKLGKALLYAVAATVAAPLTFLYTVAKFMFQTPTTKYYYLKPTMPLYWNAVSSMLNTLAVNMAIAPYGVTSAQKSLADDGTAQVTESDLKRYAAALPGIFRDDGRIDVYTMATRAQRVANEYQKHIADIMGTDLNGTPQANMDVIRDKMNSLVNGMNFFEQVQNHMTLESYVDTYFDMKMSKYSGVGGDSNTEGSSNGSSTSSANNGVNGDVSDGGVESADYNAWDNVAKEGFGSFLKAEAEDGASFVSFRVDATGPINESFQNQVGESDISQKINSIAASARSTRFDFAGGNLVGGAVGALVGQTVDSIKGFLTGLLPDVVVNGLAMAGGSAFVDIPKTWQSSMANLPRTDFTITLRSPYGNKIARYMYLYVPLCMLLAGALPLATGPQSYTSPFLCEMYCRSRSQIRLGMIDSISIQRGGGDLPWGADDGPLQIDVTISFVDMSSIMYMPIAPNTPGIDTAVAAAIQGIGSATGSSDAASKVAGAVDKVGAFLSSSTYSEDNSYSDYMAVLGGLSLADQIYWTQKWKLNVSKHILDNKAWRSPAQFASMIIGTTPGRWLSAIADRTDRP